MQLVKGYSNQVALSPVYAVTCRPRLYHTLPLLQMDHASVVKLQQTSLYTAIHLHVICFSMWVELQELH